MTKCQRCGSDNPPTSSKCSFCGLVLQPTAAQPALPPGFGPPPGFAPPPPVPTAIPTAFAPAPPPTAPAPSVAPSMPVNATIPPPPAGAVAAPIVVPAMAATGARRTMTAVFYSYCEDPAGKHWILSEGENLVGRADTAVKCDIAIPHGTASSRHATIRCENGQIAIQDMKSTNGTYVNGRRLDPSLPYPLNDGDRVRFGAFTMNLIVTQWP